MNDLSKTHLSILDHGYVKLIETWGSDERVIEAARMSTDRGFLGWGPKEDGSPGDEKLLKYLYENKHATPFEMAGMVIEVQAPIFVFREWHRHRTQSYNEMSARYTPLPDLNYMPTIARVLMNAGSSNKQAGTISGAPELTETAAWQFLEDLKESYQQDQSFYEESLEAGVPKELARLALPVGRYSKMRASANLRNWLAFLTLRAANSAQWEIRQYAFAVAYLIECCFPRTHALFVQGMK